MILISNKIPKIQIVLGVVFVVHASNSVFALSDNTAWMDQLSEQLAKEQQCKVEYYVNLREGELGGRIFQEARVQCRDGRQFDADRISPEPLFTIKKCKPVVC